MGVENEPTNIRLLRSGKLGRMMQANAGQAGVLAHVRQVRNQQQI